MPSIPSADAEMMIPPVEITELSKVLPLKLGISQNIAVHVSPTAGNFFLCNFYLLGPFSFIFSNPLYTFSRVLDVANAGTLVAQGIKCHPARRQKGLIQVPVSVLSARGIQTRPQNRCSCVSQQCIRQLDLPKTLYN